MTHRKRTTVTVETRQRTVVRRRKGQTIAWCQRCRAEVLMFPPAEAAAFLRTTVREIFRRVEAGELHFIESEDGVLLVCRNLS